VHSVVAVGDDQVVGVEVAYLGKAVPGVVNVTPAGVWVVGGIGGAGRGDPAILPQEYAYANFAMSGKILPMEEIEFHLYSLLPPSLQPPIAFAEELRL